MESRSNCFRGDDGAPIAVRAPDLTAEPEGFVVEVGAGDRIHFLDWGLPDGTAAGAAPVTTPRARAESAPGADAAPGPDAAPEPCGVLLIHGLSQTGLAWSPVARRLRHVVHAVAMDLRGHGLSDAPTSGYQPERLVEDAIAVAEGSGLLDLAEVGSDDSPRLVIAGHGFGAIVAAWTASFLADRCAGLVLVDGGWEDIRASSGLEPDEFLRGLEEPPEVMRSMAAWLADRAAFDPESWDADQERAARATIVEVPAGRVVSATRPHALAASVEAMFDYRPTLILSSVSAPIVVLTATDDEEGTRAAELAEVTGGLRAAGRPEPVVRGFPHAGHNLMRYRPADVAAAILGLALPVG
ncbi:MAG TPA: alpha/beta hydrolase [Candidatus Saccharimonadales bacterium]|nr:alpha/beta hydrolase [Candidatus Saccharimonadales bacterium]